MPGGSSDSSGRLCDLTTTEALTPTDITCNGSSMTARLSRSKTKGSDRDVSSWMVCVHSCCYMSKANWILAGWVVLKTAADYGRDYLLPSPATNANGCLRSELRYDSALATQNRVLHHLQVDKNPEFLASCDDVLDSALIAHLPAECPKKNATTSVDGALREVTGIHELQYESYQISRDW